MRVLARTLEGCPEPVAVYAAFTEHGTRQDTLFFESSDRSHASGRRSLVMTRAAVRLSCRGRTVHCRAISDHGANVLAWLGDAIVRRGGSIESAAARSELIAHFPDVPGISSERERLAAPSPLDAVRAVLFDLERASDAEAAPLVLGSFAYDLLGVYEALPEASADPTAWPDFELWLAEELITLHHETRQTTVTRFVFGGGADECAFYDATRGLAEAVRRLGVLGKSSLGACTATTPAATGNTISGASTDTSATLAAATNTHPPAEVDLDDAAFASLVVRMKEHIVRGDVFQIVLSRSFSRPCADPLAAYARLRTLNPSPYMFYLRGEAGVLFGASPESALTVKDDADGTRRVAINPIAGTRPRARVANGSIDLDLDTRIEAELRLDEKEVAEHMMLVDLARNDVARVSEPGTRAVARLLDVVRYSHVMHLVSLVIGTLRRDLDALHAYVATMNMGTLVGAPKLSAAGLLRRYEPNRRGPYGGAVGYLTSRGELDTCIVIRSAAVGADGIARVRAGAGIVYDSDPISEADETRRKANAVLAALLEP